VRRDLNSPFDSPRDFVPRLLGVFPRGKRQCDEKLIFAQDVEAVAIAAVAAAAAHRDRDNLLTLAVIVASYF
jgi:hypothetical protein